jgi:hypothetical protein
MGDSAMLNLIPSAPIPVPVFIWERECTFACGCEGLFVEVARRGLWRPTGRGREKDRARESDDDDNGDDDEGGLQGEAAIVKTGVSALAVDEDECKEEERGLEGRGRGRGRGREGGKEGEMVEEGIADRDNGEYIEVGDVDDEGAGVGVGASAGEDEDRGLGFAY